MTACAKMWQRWLPAGVLMLPLVCWPGLEHSFSTPKILLLLLLDLVVLWKPPRAGAEWPWLLWVGAVAFSSLFAPHVSFWALLLLLAPLPLFRAPQGGLKEALLWGSAAESAVVLLQLCGLDPLRALGWQPEVFSNSRMRIYGTLGNPDFVAAWLCATLPLYSGALSRKRAWPGFCLQLAAIAATGSRVFLVASPAAFTLMALRRKRGWRWALAGLPVVAALLWLSPARPLGETIAGRLYLAQVTASHGREIPLFGYGPGGFRLEFPRWQAEWLRRGRPESTRFAGMADHAHNDFLEFWVDLGLIGLVALGILVGWILCRAWRGGGDDGGAWGGVAALLAIACVDFPFHRPAEWGLFWLLLGMLSTRRTGKCRYRTDG